ncbi:MAG: fic [Rhizobacter sp.]|nr:fic [Rhizobacter sp.]
MAAVGYEFVRESLNLTAFTPPCPALIRPVTRIQQNEDHLAVPAGVAPTSGDPLLHLLFALKHEGVNLQVLAQALPLIPAERMQAEIAAAPNGQYIRIACYLWETLTGHKLDSSPGISGKYVELFDSQRYITGPSRRNQRWRVAFNGLGTPRYCVTVERTHAIEAGIESNILARAKAFIDGLGEELTDRALAWAYLHETEDSYAIEREAPSEDKARAFIQLLKQAHEGRPLDEAYLVELQSSVVTNPLDKAVEFRNQQNWLRGPHRGAAGVTYVPPPPAWVEALMGEWMAFANEAPRLIDPIVAASIASFGFVFIQPFMDGNGRLSRFLFHKALCTSGKLDTGMLLPVSVAMKRHEKEYLEVLQDYSRKARERVNVTWLDGDDFRFEFKTDASIYRYWDATACVEFGFRMAEQALDIELKQETSFLAHFDAIRRAVEDRYDVRGSVLATLISISIQAQGTISRTKRKRYADLVPATTFDFIEQVTRDVLASEPSIPEP